LGRYLADEYHIDSPAFAKKIFLPIHSQSFSRLPAPSVPATIIPESFAESIQ
jgi:hypothetical protein